MLPTRSSLNWQKFYYYFSFFIILLFSHPLQANEKNSAALQKADAFYDEGNCSKALEAYQSIPKSETIGSSQDEVLYKTSSCQFELEMYPQAEIGFKNYLKKSHRTKRRLFLYSFCANN